MSLSNIFNIAGSAMSAQALRMNTTASNIANAENISSNEKDVYKAKHPVFSTILESVNGDNTHLNGVMVTEIIESSAPAKKRYEPGNPLSDENGYIYMSNVNLIEEMANMISTSRSYQNNVDVMDTAKKMMLSALRLGQ